MHSRKMLKRVGDRKHPAYSEAEAVPWLVLEVLFTQDSEVEDLFCGASSGSEPSLFFSNYFFSLGFKPIQDNFQHDFA